MYCEIRSTSGHHFFLFLTLPSFLQGKTREDSSPRLYTVMHTVLSTLSHLYKIVLSVVDTNVCIVHMHAHMHVRTCTHTHTHTHTHTYTRTHARTHTNHALTYVYTVTYAPENCSVSHTTIHHTHTHPTTPPTHPVFRLLCLCVSLSNQD